MAVRFADRMKWLKASEIREILKLTQNPEVISFAGGLPAAELFPVKEILAASAEVLEQQGCQALQYSTTEGCLDLRNAIAERMNRFRGTRVSGDRILITCGSQQGLDLTGKLFLDPGDAILCESPTYIGAINAFRAYQPRFVQVPTDDDGMIPDELERLVRETERVKLLYVVPDFQNPSGRTWSLERRRGLLDVAERHEIPIIEDSPYAEVCFEGEAPPSILSLDERGLVVYLSTFSKIFCPGLRIGWLAAEQSLFERYVLAKQGADLHTSSLSQHLIRTYMARHDMDANVERIRRTYRRRRDVMVEAIAREFPEGIRHTRPRGGLFLWVELPAGADAKEILVRALDENVAFVPGGSFFPNGGGENTMRLNYSAMPEERIVEGIRRLGRVLRETLAVSGGLARRSES
ncbi:MAG: aminotransferase class I/II-fold pyridoxal phosphate-dependent enzyme [Candidatus Eisenbacteria bacterium]|nr:aminotransferase class I/II-fold pyridoxal phosphate-dependent enzyme [Candidatus Latescibacterota bacterium]MBD3301238.1 aminotransferase class I/II-fold pyridoxal phosphate-dependent enzyme [Candidatus Eisenbacteria bacterium]